MASPAGTDLGVFESHRALLLAHAYRMLGDLGRAEDMVQDAWLRWNGRRVAVEAPRAYLVTLITRLCLNELESARTRHEENRGDRLPEPIDLREGGLGRLEALDHISMAFLVVLQRLTPAERAVLLLREVFDFDYKDVSALVGKSETACRQLLARARKHVKGEKRLFEASPREHARLLTAFTEAASAGNVDALVAMLAEDAVLVTDGGADGRRLAGIRNLRVPLSGSARIAAFVTATARSIDLDVEMHELNGQPALVFFYEQAPFAALLLAVTDGRIHRVYFHADLSRMRYLGARTRPA